MRQRRLVVHVGDRDEDHGRIAVLLRARQRVLEGVAVAVVERDQHRARAGAARRACSGRARRRGRRPCSRARGAARAARRRRATGTVVGFSGRSLTLWYMSTRSVRVAVRRSAAPRRRGGLADRPVERVLDELLALLGASSADSLGAAARRRDRRQRAGARPRPVRRSRQQSCACGRPRQRGRARRRAAWASSRRLDEQAVDAVLDDVGDPADRASRPTARPRQNASITTRGRPSERDGSTRHVASSSAGATSSVSRSSTTSARQVATSASTTALASAADEAQRRARAARGAARRHAAASPSTFL